MKSVAILVTALGAAIASNADAAIYWNVFNIENENAITADIVTYATLDDMLHDTNRLVDISPNHFGFGKNVVDSGSDGHVFWNVFNIEDENAITSDIVTYATLDDMLHDNNRLVDISPNHFGFGKNVVGSGAFVTLPSAVPEPASWAMMLGGFSLLGAVIRSRRAAQVRFGYADLRRR